MSLSSLANKFTPDQNLASAPRPYFNHSVSFKAPITQAQRLKALEQAGLNIFFYPAEFISGCDFLSDSGTTTMTDQQWASLHLGDESYGSNQGYFLLATAIQKTFGEEFFNLNSQPQNAFLFHQGRSAEHALFSQVGRLGSDLIIPSNGHFDTTYANISANKIQALNFHSPELKNENSNSHFKGNIDIQRLEKLLKEKGKKVPLIFLTITNNTAAGQPVSLANIKQVSKLAQEYHIPLFFDACRFAENAWFIQQYEEDYKSKTILEVVHEIFKQVDGFTISFKKDGLANMGGGLFFRSNGLFVKKYPDIAGKITDHQILTEGNPTYGGMSGRDIMALTKGLETIIREDYLTYRINQVKQFGDLLSAQGLPVIKPFGGHAIYLDMDKFFADTNLKPEDFGGISFTALLLGLYGHRACELGNFAFGKFDSVTKAEKQAEVNFVRFAVPRLRYESEDLAASAAAIKELYDQRQQIPGVKVVYGQDLPLRHFKARFEFK